MAQIKVKGMSCNHCRMAVTKAVEGVAGTKNVNVDLTAATATWDEDKPVDVETVKAAVRDAGYEVP